MALHDFVCPTCGFILQDQYRSLAVGATGDRPTCPACGAPEMEWIVPVVAMDVGGVKGAAFRAFTVDVDGTAQVIDSLHTLRKVERDSEQRFRNGEGEPMRFRMWNNDRTNKDVHSFGTAGTIGEQTYDSGQAPQQKSGRVSITRHGVKPPKVTVARHAGQSPLK